MHTLHQLRKRRKIERACPILWGGPMACKIILDIGIGQWTWTCPSTDTFIVHYWLLICFKTVNFPIANSLKCTMTSSKNGMVVVIKYDCGYRCEILSEYQWLSDALFICQFHLDLERHHVCAGVRATVLVICCLEECLRSHFPVTAKSRLWLNFVWTVSSVQLCPNGGIFR